VIESMNGARFVHDTLRRGAPSRCCRKKRCSQIERQEGDVRTASGVAEPTGGLLRFDATD
jgi:hypothetical protein